MSKFQLLVNGKLRNKALFPVPPSWCMTREGLLRKLDLDDESIIALTFEGEVGKERWLGSYNSSLKLNPACYIIEAVGFEDDFHYNSKFKVNELLPARIGMQTPVLFEIDGKRCGILNVVPYLNYFNFVLERLEGTPKCPKKK